MSNSTPTRTWMARLTLRWIGTRGAKRAALLRASPVCTAQLGQPRPQAQVAARLLI
jgi:hypothetical protein